MTELLTTVSIIFIVAGPFLLLSNRLNVPAAPFLIIAGLIAGLFIDEQLTLELARWGIALLVFFFGVQLQFDAIRVVLGDSERVAISQVLLVGSFGVAVGIGVGLPPEQALYIGIAGALSSTIVGTTLMQTDIRRNLVRGRLAESINFVQDILAILIILILSAESLSADPIATKIGYGVILLLAAVVVNRYLFDSIERLAEGSTEQMIVSIIALLVAFLGLAEVTGVSIVVGAFAAGLAVQYNPETYFSVFDGLESIRDFFVAIFFVMVGALVAVPTAEVLVLAALIGIITAVIKPAITTLLLIERGYGRRSATLTSLNLDQVSEFALIIAIEALLFGMIVQSVFDAIILAAAATMITSSLSRRYDEQIYRYLSQYQVFERQHRKIDERSSVPDDLTDHVIIVGFGRQGRQLAETCERVDVPYVVVENDPAKLTQLEAQASGYIFADAIDAYTWEKATVEAARMIASTVNSPPVSESLLRFAGDHDLILTTNDIDDARTYLDRGALYVCVNDALASEQLLEYIDGLENGSLKSVELREQAIANIDDVGAD